VRALSLGQLEGDADAVTGVQVDSRRVRPGDLFVAVSGGEAFLGDARAHGAAVTLVPEDAHAALAALGSAVRDRSDARVVAITGSVGKTSTKDILAALLRPHLRTVAAEDGFNNEIGLPLTICRIEPETEGVVTEMAMRAPGQIRDLARIARPHIGVITSIAPVHLERLGSLENIARAKAELLEELPTGAVAILPDGVPELEPFVPEGRKGPRESVAPLVAPELVGEVEKAVFPFQHELDADGVVDRMSSTSFVASAPDLLRRAFFANLRQHPCRIEVHAGHAPQGPVGGTGGVA